MEEKATRNRVEMTAVPVLSQKAVDKTKNHRLMKSIEASPFLDRAFSPVILVDESVPKLLIAERSEQGSKIQRKSV